MSGWRGSRGAAVDQLQLGISHTQAHLAYPPASHAPLLAAPPEERLARRMQGRFEVISITSCSSGTPLHAKQLDTAGCEEDLRQACTVLAICAVAEVRRAFLARCLFWVVGYLGSYCEQDGRQRQGKCLALNQVLYFFSLEAHPCSIHLLRHGVSIYIIFLSFPRLSSPADHSTLPPPKPPKPSRSHKWPVCCSCISLKAARKAADVIIVFSESISEGTLKTWLKKPGDWVKADEEIASIETDKVGLSHIHATPSTESLYDTRSMLLSMRQKPARSSRSLPRRMTQCQ